MKVVSLKTHKITQKDKDLFKILDKYILSFKNNSVLVVTSKIVSIVEGRIILQKDVPEKDELIRGNAQFYLDRTKSQYKVMLSINNNILVASAGIDESNGNGYYILWPQDPQDVANKIREYLRKKFNIRNVGVVISDSTLVPLRWGTRGVSLAHSGFLALNNYIGTPDIFGKPLIMTTASVADGLAIAAVLVMGEGKEQTPLAVIEDVPFVKFQPRNPTKKELKDLRIEIRDDLYAPILTKAGWKKGGRSRKDML